MNKRFFLTPYFLDGERPYYKTMLQDEWQLNETTPGEGADIQHRVLPIYQSIAAFVAETAAEGEIPVSLTGDCCMSLPVLKGLQAAGIEPTLLWLDAHGDFNTWETTPSGFLGGMPLAMMVGRGEQTWIDELDLELLPEEKVIFTDGRDLDPEELVNLQNSNIQWVKDPAELLEQELPDHLWVHFDSDILRLSDAPAMSYPAEGGPELETLRQLFQKLRESGKVAAVSVSMWNPELEGADISETNTMSLVKELVG